MILPINTSWAARKWCTLLSSKFGATRLLHSSAAITKGISAVVNTTKQDEDAIMEADSYMDALQLCADSNLLAVGQQIHSRVIASGYENHEQLGFKLLLLYSKCGELNNGYTVLTRLPNPNTFGWNSLIRGCLSQMEFFQALGYYTRMHNLGYRPDNFTYPFVLKACANAGYIRLGCCVHAQCIKYGLELNVYTSNTLMAMYGKSGFIKNAEMVFETLETANVVSWNTMIAGYTENALGIESLNMFEKMRFQGVKPDNDTVVGVLNGCALVRYLKNGMGIHGYIVKSGLGFGVKTMNSLIDMYMKCGDLEDGRQVFDEMSARDIVSWTVVLSGYAENGPENVGLRHFRDMVRVYSKVDVVALSCILSAVASLATLHHGREIHGYAIRRDMVQNVFVGSALIDMYAKCGTLEAAKGVFQRVAERNVVSWTAMIVAYGVHGFWKEVFKMFYSMLGEGLRPNHVTFVGLLSACSHAGLVDIGLGLFESMSKDFGVLPQVGHYACMVDLLARTGHLDRALEFLQKGDLDLNPVIWSTILGACKSYGNLELGRMAAEKLFVLEPKNPGHYVVFSNICANSGNVEEVLKVRKLMERRGVKKMPGYSWIEINNKVHVFVSTKA